MSKLLTGLLLILLVQSPALGQNIQRSSAGASSVSLDAMSFEMQETSSMDLERGMETSIQARQASRATELAVALVEILASQNTYQLDGIPAGTMDAYLRQPRESDTSDDTIFHVAKSLYDDATSINSPRYHLKIDPLSLRCVLKVKLSRLLSR